MPEKSEAGTEWPEPRVLWREAEGGQIWKVAHREGAILLETVCQAWDQDDLAHMTLTGGDAIVPATKYWLGILTYTNVESLRRQFQREDAVSGFGNRFLWLLLPDSDTDLAMPTKIPHGLIERYRVRLDLAGGLSGSGVEVDFSPAAADLWRDMYPVVKRDKGAGAVEGMLSRAETQVLRLALNYHLAAGGKLEPQECVSIEALHAALAVWAYCKASAEYVFHDVTGDLRVDKLVAHLESEGGWRRVEDLKKWRPGDVDEYVKLGLKQGIIVAGTRRLDGAPGRPSNVYAVRSWVDDGRLVHNRNESFNWK
jgi:hypothetical protein